MKCSKCKTEMKRYYNKETEKRHKEDAKFFGVPWVPGTLACPVCYPEFFVGGKQE